MENDFFNYKVFVLPESGDALKALKGNNRKHILIVASDEGWPEQAQFLHKIFKAAAVDMASDALLLEDPNNLLLPSFSQITRNYPIDCVFLFGIAPLDLGIQAILPTNAPFEWQGRFFFISKSLKEIDATPALKRPLWDFLKSRFLG